MDQEASFYQFLEDQKVQCELCAHRCLIRPGRRGICHVRENQAGRLVSLNYGRLIAEHVDPIEKKPLYHFLPGSKAFSIAAPGCNLRCEWCQNWQISQAGAEVRFDRLPYVAPQAVVEDALRTGCRSIAYTYTEPTVFYEYTRDVARLAKSAGLKNIYVTNGYMTAEALIEITEWLDAANVDIKAFSPDVYRKMTGADLGPVLESCRALKKQGVWLEVTTLLVTGINDDRPQLEALADFISTELGTETPWHLSRYFPQYKSKAPMTSSRSLAMAEEIGRKKGLKFIYPGNVHASVETRCLSCDRVVLVRDDYELLENKLVEGCCPYCDSKIAGVFTGD